MHGKTKPEQFRVCKYKLIFCFCHTKKISMTKAKHIDYNHPSSNRGKPRPQTINVPEDDSGTFKTNNTSWHGEGCRSVPLPWSVCQPTLPRLQRSNNSWCLSDGADPVRGMSAVEAEPDDIYLNTSNALPPLQNSNSRSAIDSVPMTDAKREMLLKEAKRSLIDLLDSKDSLPATAAHNTILNAASQKLISVKKQLRVEQKAKKRANVARMTQRTVY